MMHRLLRWQMAIPVLAGIAVVVIVWWVGPSALGSVSSSGAPTIDATVTAPASCTAAKPAETVQFQIGGQTRTGLLDACGHDKGNQVEITAPAAGESSVHLADVVAGHGDLRAPLGLALVALSCLSGGAYVFLIRRHTVALAS